ncbi:MAG: GAF domain-containing sensor histidine kinase [Actinomycetota bacterium]
MGLAYPGRKEVSKTVQVTLLIVSVTASVVLAALLLRSERRRRNTLVREIREIAIHEITGTLTRSGDVEEVLKGLFTQATSTLEADVTLVALIDEDAGELVGFASQGATEVWADFRMPLGNPTSAAASAVRLKQILAVVDLASSRFRDGSVMGKMKMRGAVFAPLIVDAKATGVLIFGFRSKTPTFSTDYLDLVRVLTAESALGLDRSRHVEDLQSLDKQKDEFITMVSHELRNPLTTIKGFADLVRRGRVGPVNEAQSNYLQIVTHSADRMFSLVDDLMTVSRAEGGLLSMSRRSADLVVLIEQTILANSVSATERGVEIVLDPEPSLPHPEIDRKRIEQVFSNLLGNAVKFTPSGGRIDVRCSYESGGLLTEVCDTGVGIPDKEQDRLFEKFFRASTATDSATPGTGLGLAISKAIVELHGGHIGAESNEGEGSRFHFWLPVGAS